MPSRRSSRPGLLFLLGATLAPMPLLAQGINQSEPLTIRPRESLTTVQRSFALPTWGEATFVDRRREPLPESVPAFFRDSTLKADLRTYYRDKVTTGSQPASVTEAWAIGGSLSWESGKLFDRLHGGVTLHTALPLYAPEAYGNTGLLLPNQSGFAVVGQLYGQIDLPYEHTVTAGRYAWDTPYIGRHDNRMVPNTFYGYTVQRVHEDKGRDLSFRYGGGYIAAIKQRDADTFVPMSQAAGAPVDRGTAAGGGVLTWGPASLGVFEYYTQDILNILYAEGSYGGPVWPHAEAILSAQFADQRSTGANLMTGSYFATDQVGVRLQAGSDPFMLTAAFSQVGGGAAMQNPWSNNPFYTDGLVLDFQRAGEGAVLLGGTLNLRHVGLPGVTVQVQYFDGWTSAVPGGPLVESEWDVTVDWRPQERLPGLWFRVAYGVSQTWQGASYARTHEARAILNYRLRVF